jgi:hypothetical protein
MRGCPQRLRAAGEGGSPARPPVAVAAAQGRSVQDITSQAKEETSRFRIIGGRQGRTGAAPRARLHVAREGEQRGVADGGGGRGPGPPPQRARGELKVASHPRPRQQQPRQEHRRVQRNERLERRRGLEPPVLRACQERRLCASVQPAARVQATKPTASLAQG